MPRLSRQELDEVMEEIEPEEEDPEITFQRFEDATNDLVLGLMDDYRDEGWDDYDPFLDRPLPPLEEDDPDPNFSQRFYDEPNDDFPLKPLRDNDEF